MITITLFCAGGLSTSLLVNKMKIAAAAKGVECNISAHGLASVDKYGPAADVILLGPQVRYAEKEIQSKFPDKPVCSIEMRVYGTMDGKTVLESALKALGK